MYPERGGVGQGQAFLEAARPVYPVSSAWGESFQIPSTMPVCLLVFIGSRFFFLKKAGSSRDPECPKNALRDLITEANLAPPLKNADCIQPPSGRAAPTALQLSANLQPPLRLPLSQSIDVSALHTPLTFNHASCKSRGLSVSVEEPVPELIALADGGDPDNNARQLTTPLNPAPRKTRDPRRAWERFAVGLVWLDDGRQFVGCGMTLEPGQSLCLPSSSDK